VHDDDDGGGGGCLEEVSLYFYLWRDEKRNLCQVVFNYHWRIKLMRIWQNQLQTRPGRSFFFRLTEGENSKQPLLSRVDK